MSEAPKWFDRVFTHLRSRLGSHDVLSIWALCKSHSRSLHVAAMDEAAPYFERAVRAVGSAAIAMNRPEGAAGNTTCNCGGSIHQRRSARPWTCDGELRMCFGGIAQVAQVKGLTSSQNTLADALPRRWHGHTL